jgi:drug/metabolite transporter (DMT)-like permease
VAQPRTVRPSGDLALIVAAVCFGTTFVVVQRAITLVEPVPFLAVRFLLGAAALWPIARRRPSSHGELRDGAMAGVALLLGYVFQTIGLQYTSSATSAFITYLLVVFVPVLGLVLLRRRPHPITLGGIAVAVAGLVLLTDPGGGGEAAGFGRGEVLTLGCAIAFAAHVVVLGETAGRHDPFRMATVQVGVVGLACLIPGFWLGGYGFPASATVAAVATGLFATALAFVLQVSGQRTVPPARAALVLLLEPVFAAILAALTGDALTGSQLAGAALILVAVVLSETLPDVLARRRPEPASSARVPVSDASRREP